MLLLLSAVARAPVLAGSCLDAISQAGLAFLGGTSHAAEVQPAWHRKYDVDTLREATHFGGFPSLT